MEKLKTYIRESYHELRKVDWPTKDQTIHLTMMVIGFAIVISFALGVFDIAFARLMNIVIA